MALVFSFDQTDRFDELCISISRLQSNRSTIFTSTYERHYSTLLTTKAAQKIISQAAPDGSEKQRRFPLRIL